MKTNVAEAWLDLVEGMRDITHEIAALGPEELFSREAENPEALKDLQRATEALKSFENRLRLNQKHPWENQ